MSSTSRERTSSKSRVGERLFEPRNLLQSDFTFTTSMDSDERQLNALGYKQTLSRQWGLIESFASSFASVYFVGGLRMTFIYGTGAGGPAAFWSSYVITCIFVFITAAVLAEICSALPVAGSIYFWAAESWGKKYGRLFGFLAAWWSCTGWTAFLAFNSYSAANFLLSEIDIFGLDFTTDVNNIRFRAVQWVVSEVILFIALSMNYLNPRMYASIFRLAIGVMLLDFFLNITWLPIAVANSYGFQSASFVFTETLNESGAPPVWNWMLSFYYTAIVIVGYEAPGHISEETQNASITAARGIFSSTVASGLLGIPIVIVFLFCTPDLKTLYSFSAPQPFVNLYALSMGTRGHIFMNAICILGLIMNTTVSGVASSRLIWAIARDGVLPFSSWIRRVSDNKQPRNAIIVMHGVAALLLCFTLPSPVAFTSVVSAGGAPTVMAYAVICFGRTFITPHSFRNARWSLGRWSRPLNLVAFVYNLYLAAVLFSPVDVPVLGHTISFSVVIFGVVTVFAVVTWAVTPEKDWLPAVRLGKVAEMEKTINVRNAVEGRRNSVSP